MTRGSRIVLIFIRFSNHPALADASPWNRGNAFAKESALLLDLTDISLKTVQACVLLGVASRSEGEGGAESVYYSVACRIANLLDLANMPTKDALQRELNSRGTHFQGGPRSVTHKISQFGGAYQRLIPGLRQELDCLVKWSILKMFPYQWMRPLF